MKTNSMKMWALAGAVFASGVLMSSDANAVSFKLMGAGTVVAKPLSPAPGMFNVTGTTKKFNFGGGPSVFFGGPAVGLEVGASYLTSQSNLTTDLFGEIGIEYSYLQVPVLVRFNLGRIVSIGVGGYLNKGLGKVTSTDQAGATETAFDVDTTGGLA
jgi:hypothetical protein